MKFSIVQGIGSLMKTKAKNPGLITLGSGVGLVTPAPIHALYSTNKIHENYGRDIKFSIMQGIGSLMFYLSYNKYACVRTMPKRNLTFRKTESMILINLNSRITS